MIIDKRDLPRLRPGGPDFALASQRLRVLMIRKASAVDVTLPLRASADQHVHT
jgi:hypothetical protein